MTNGEIYASALKVQNLTNEEWDAFNAFFDEHDLINDDMKKDKPVLFRALLRMKENQAKIETLDALNAFCNGKYDEMVEEKSRVMTGFACGF